MITQLDEDRVLLHLYGDGHWTLYVRGEFVARRAFKTPDIAEVDESQVQTFLRVCKHFDIQASFFSGWAGYPKCFHIQGV